MTDSNPTDETGEADQPFVLLVEDNPLQLQLRSELLTRLGLNVVPIMSSVDAKDALDSRVIDAVVVDINLGPDRDDRSGVDVAAFARDKSPTIPIVGYSGVIDEREADRLRFHFDELYVKGAMNINSIHEMLEHVRDLAQAHQSDSRSGEQDD